MFFAIVDHFDLHCHQMNVKTAFLNADLEQVVYTEQPERCVEPKKPDFVCKLQKSLYGLKQAPRQWCAKISSFLTKTLNVQSSPYDPCLYFCNKNSNKSLISLYGDERYELPSLAEKGILQTVYDGGLRGRKCLSRA